MCCPSIIRLLAIGNCCGWNLLTSGLMANICGVSSFFISSVLSDGAAVGTRSRTSSVLQIVIFNMK